MEAELWKLVGGALASLVVAVILWQLQQGSPRRRQRREIREELELIVLLDQHPEVQKRLRSRVASLLEAYESGAPSRAARIIDWVIAVVVSIGLLVLFFGSEPDPSFFDSLLIGGMLGAVANIVFAALQLLRRSRRS